MMSGINRRIGDNLGRPSSMALPICMCRQVDVRTAVDVLREDLGRLGLHVNTIMIGACDGTSDDLIESVQLRNDTSAMLVEPVPHNFADLTRAMHANGRWKVRTDMHSFGYLSTLCSKRHSRHDSWFHS